MHAIRSSLTTKLRVTVLVAVAAIVGVIVAASTVGAAEGHSKLQDTALLSRAHKNACERGRQSASRESDSRHDETRQRDTERGTEMSCGRERGDELGQSDGRRDHEDAAEAEGSEGHGHQDEHQRGHLAEGRE